jgi:hypothetical protein
VFQAPCSKARGFKRLTRVNTKIIAVLVIVCAAALVLLFTLDIRTGKLLKAHVIYGGIKDGMVSAKASGRALYLFKGQRSGILKPISDNEHDLIFFPVTPEELAGPEVAIATYSPWYPFWLDASPVFYDVEYERLKCRWDESAYEEKFRRGVKCMIVGNGLFSRRVEDFELWYFEKP